MQVNTRYMHKLHKRNFVSFVYSLMLAISENGIYFIKLWVAVSKGDGGGGRGGMVVMGRGE